MTVKMECPNCKGSVYVRFHKNRWCESFKGDCWQCGWRFLLKDSHFPYVQPNAPFFEMIYGQNPEKMAEKKRKELAWREEERKLNLQRKYDERFRGGLKPWLKKAIEKEVLGGK